MARAYGASYLRQEGATPGSYLMDHTRNAILYDPDGRPLAMIPYDHGPQGAADELRSAGLVVGEPLMLPGNPRRTVL